MRHTVQDWRIIELIRFPHPDPIDDITTLLDEHIAFLLDHRADFYINGHCMYGGCPADTMLIPWTLIKSLQTLVSNYRAGTFLSLWSCVWLAALAASGN